MFDAEEKKTTINCVKKTEGAVGPKNFAEVEGTFYHSLQLLLLFFLKTLAEFVALSSIHLFGSSINHFYSLSKAQIDAVKTASTDKCEPPIMDQIF
jgi:hypothetical protein